MSEYADRFVENGIDLSVLPDLTDQDLKDIGILLGHRRKLLRAIAEITGATQQRLPRLRIQMGNPACFTSSGGFIRIRWP